MGLAAERRSYSVYDTGAPLPVKVWDHGVPMEPEVYEQARKLSLVPGVERVAIMPDAHVGLGACVGSAILTRDVVVPAAVGVDIGCGMVAVPLTIQRGDLPPALGPLRAAIESVVPVGRTNNGQAGDRGAWGDVPADVQRTWALALESGYEDLVAAYPDFAHQYVRHHLGTLGTGNHFLEVCVELDAARTPDQGTPSELQRVWLMLHSGSRGIGNKIGQGFTRLAQRECARWHVALPDKDLAFLPRGTALFDDYLRFAHWAQQYAWQSRLLMLERMVTAVQQIAPGATRIEAEQVHCHHNYIAQERHVGKPGLLTRKGAVDASAGVLGIIPGSMGARSYITRGKGNPEALMTSSHGAGRVLSRAAAKKAYTLEDHTAAVAGVECRIDADVIDETPMAYKPIEAVMAAQADLTEPVVTLKQIVCVKG